MAFGDPLNSFEELYERSGPDLLARMLYSEARGESTEGKVGCAFVAKNRKDYGDDTFGGSTWQGVLLKEYQFDGMTTEAALRPDITKAAWEECLDIALDVTRNYGNYNNPIGGCLWFNANATYSNNSKVENGKEYYRFGTNASYNEVVEKVIIGGHTFFRIVNY